MIHHLGRMDACLYRRSCICHNCSVFGEDPIELSDLVRPVGLLGRPLGVIPRRLLETVEFLLYTLPFFAHKRSFARVYSVRRRGFCGKMKPMKSPSTRVPYHRKGQKERFILPCIRNTVPLTLCLCALLRPAQAPHSRHHPELTDYSPPSKRDSIRRGVQKRSILHSGPRKSWR